MERHRFLALDERIARFGQDDHVRYYGSDFERRLHKHGLNPTVIWPAMVLDSNDLERLGIAPNEEIWLCSTMTVPPTHYRSRAELAADLARTDAELERFRHQPVLRLALALSRPLRKHLKRFRAGSTAAEPAVEDHTDSGIAR